jgi:CelD/BcsL family acetyltransferase involved in cellulose biosynthesis
MNIAALSSAADRIRSDDKARHGGVTQGAPHAAPEAAPRVELFDAFVAAESLWRRLAPAQPLITPYQSFAWINHWFDHVGRPEGGDPLVAAGLDRDGEPLFILPLIREFRHGCTVARFCGGNHSNLNMAIWRSDIAAALTGPQVIGLLGEVARARDIDLFTFLGQPPSWRGVRNPFATLPQQPSPDDVYNGGLDPSGPQFEPHLPSGMRKKARKLRKLDGFRYFTAQTPDDVDRILTAFWPQKAARFARQGIHNVFDDPGVKEFIHAGCRDGLDEGRPAIELHALEGGGDMLAIVGGAANAERFSVMFNSITDTEYARLSPGIILMADIVAACAKRGLTSFDLGAGHAPYKDYFCSGTVGRFDCFIPFSRRGRLLAAACQASDALRRSLKTTPALMSALQTMRRWTTGGAGRAG